MSQSRYITLPNNTKRTMSIPRAIPPNASYWDSAVDDFVLMPSSVTVVEQDASPEYTGLFDAMGRDLYRVPERVKIGFHT